MKVIPETRRTEFDIYVLIIQEQLHLFNIHVNGY